MSWLSSLANSLGADDENNREKDDHHYIESSSEEDPGGRGVKEDLSELTKTLTRQLWGVASFLAPPPPPPPRDPSISDSNRISGIRSDFAEIGGKFKTEISKLSSHKAVSEISKIASNFFGSEEDLIGDAVGVTKEVLTFARNIAMHPETWLDFPLSDDEDSDDFDMSDAQQEHALAVERLAPRLAALRIELCPGYMSEGCFWKIYFVLLHPRLDKHDAELLSTPQIVEARAMLMQDLQNRTKTELELSGRSASYSKDSPKLLQEEHYSSLSTLPSENMPLKTFACEPSDFLSATDIETEKHPVTSTEMQIVDKSVVKEEPVIQNKNKDVLVSASTKHLDKKYEEDEDEDEDDWLEDESSEMGAFSGTGVSLGNEEDVSFSDLEDDDEKIRPTSSKTVTDSSKTESRDWVQLNRRATDSKGNHSVGSGHLEAKHSHANNPENKDSNDWLNVDETDVI